MGKNCELITCTILVFHVAFFFSLLPSSIRLAFLEMCARNRNGVDAPTTSFLATNSPGNSSTPANEDVRCVRK